MNVASIIEGHADDVVALISRNRETTYGELRDQVALVPLDAPPISETPVSFGRRTAGQ